MNLAEITAALKLRLSNPLPGEEAHKQMRAVSVGQFTPRFEHGKPPRPGAVLILLYQEGDSVRFPLIRRAEYVGAHSGQISLPGGKSEVGEGPVQTALREAEEEIGVQRSVPQLLGLLTNFFVIPSNFMITPVIAAMNEAPVFKPDPHEVAGILSCSIDELVHADAIRQKEIIAAQKYRMIAPHFEIEGAVVWGATAMMLNEFRSVLKESF
jgi:8-oxo-dGTP pyrophosphatase MutT (NUDIX family)